MCILFVYTLLKVVSYYDLSVLSMSVMGFQTKVWLGGVGGWGCHHHHQVPSSLRRLAVMILHGSRS